MKQLIAKIFDLPLAYYKDSCTKFFVIIKTHTIHPYFNYGPNMPRLVCDNLNELTPMNEKAVEIIGAINQANQ